MNIKELIEQHGWLERLQSLVNLDGMGCLIHLRTDIEGEHP